MPDTKNLGVGIVGFGYWGPNLVRNYLNIKGCTLEYICDKLPERAKKAKDIYPSVKVTQNFEDLIEDSKVDAIVIATPISTHYPLGKKALMKKKHVFIEKPLAGSVRQAEDLDRLAKINSVTLMVGHTFVYSPPVIKIKEIIESGELGDIYYISSSRVNLGLHQADASVIWDLAPHDLSILFYWLDEEPESIQTFGRGCINPELPDVAFLNMSFPSGIVAQLHLSWLSPVKLRRTTIVGDKKMLLYDDTESVEKVKIFDHGVNYFDPSSFGEYQLSYRTGDIVSPHIENMEPLYIEANHFIDCIKHNRTPVSDGRAGIEVVKAIEGAERSLMSNGNFSRKEPWIMPLAENQAGSTQTYI